MKTILLLSFISLSIASLAQTTMSYRGLHMFKTDNKEYSYINIKRVINLYKHESNRKDGLKNKLSNCATQNQRLNNKAILTFFNTDLNWDYRLNYANKYLTNALAIDPENKTVVYNLAIITAYDNNYASAIDLLSQTDKNAHYFYYQLATINAAQHNYKMAIYNNDLFLMKDKHYQPALYNTGICYIKLNDEKHSIFYLKRAKTNDYRVYQALGYAYDKIGRYKESFESYKQAHKLNPDDTELHIETLQAANKIGNYNYIQDDLSKLESFGKKNSEFCTQQGFMFLNKKLYDDAIKSFTEALNANINNYLAYYGKGRAHYDRKEYKFAINCFNNALYLMPSYKPAIEAKAFAYIKQNKKSQAIYLLSSIIPSDSLKNKDLHLVYTLAGLYLNREYYDQALEQFSRIKNFKWSYYPETQFAIAICFMNLYEMDSASKYINRAQFNKALTSDLYCIKGNMHLYSYDFNTALKLFKRSNMVNPKNDDALNGIGMCYLHLEQPLKAIIYFEKGLKNNPESYTLLNNLALAYHHAGQYFEQIDKHDTANFYFQKALESFDFAATKNPDAFVYCMNNKGIVFKDMNLSDSAIKCFSYVTTTATLNNKGVVFAKQNQNDTAYSLFSSAINIDPKRFELHSNRSQLNMYSNSLIRNSDSEFLSNSIFKPRRSTFSNDNYYSMYYFMFSDPIKTYIIEDFEIEFTYSEPDINEVYAHDFKVFKSINE